MKRLTMLSLFLVFAMNIFSQSLSDIEKMINDKQYQKAKTAVDKFTSEPKNSGNAEGWYNKGFVYYLMSFEPGTSLTDNLAYKNIAFEAFKKSQLLDPRDIRMKLEQYKPYANLYLGLFDVGTQFFNNKQFQEAFQAFAKAQEIEDYILSKNYTYEEVNFSKLDTSLVKNMAVSLLQAKDEAGAVKYYKKLADANVSEENHLDVYEYLGSYYLEHDPQALTALLAKARSFYPNNAYWNELEINAVTKTGDQQAIYQKYEQLIENNPDNFPLGYNYAVMLYNNIYGKDAKPATETEKMKLKEVVKKVIPNDKGNDALIIMTSHLYNMAADYSSQASMVSGNKPEDIKKKKELNAKAVKLMEEYLPYAEELVKWYEAQPSLKAGQKATFRELLINISEVYSVRGDAKKAAEYEKKKSQIK